jgi:iron complex outermembrane receptor protein
LDVVAKKCRLLAATLLWALALASAIPPDALADDQLAEVIVTAQRRAEPLEKVPISVTAITADAISRSNILTSQELDAVTPGLVTSTVNGNSQPFIRGVGAQSTILGNESSVATYIDGVYVASTTGSVYSLNNIDRIEVLRGPQGTLFGRNATAGVVQVVTLKPSFTPVLNASVSYMNYQTSVASVYGSTRLTDSIAANLAVFGQYQGEGFGRNIATGQELNYNNEYSVRSQFLFKPTEPLSVLISLDYDNQRNDLGTNRQTYDGSRTILGGARVGGPFDGNYNFRPVDRNWQYGSSIDSTLDLGFANLRSITAYRKYSWLNDYDQDATTARIIDVVRNELQHTIQQELILSGALRGFDWTAGLFYFHFGASIQPISTQATPVSTTNVTRLSQLDLDSYAGYAQGTYAISSRLKATAGLRYTQDRSTLNGTLVSLPGSPAPAGTVLASVTNKDLSANKVTWRGALDYQLTDEAMAYVSASRGFKSGSFNLTSITQVPTRPEVLDAYEAGVKSNLLERRLRVNAAAFHYKYTDIQLVQVAPPPINIQTLNAAAARINGGELEIVAVPTVPYGHLETGASVSALDAKYTSFPNAPYFLPNPFTNAPAGVLCAAPSAAPGGNSSCKFDASGRTMIRAPKWTLGLNLDYAAGIAQGEAEFALNYYHSNGFYWETSNRIRQSPYDVVNAQLAYGLHGSPWRFRVFVKNLTNELYYSSVSEQAVGDIATAEAPRTYGIGFDYRLP